MATPVNFSNLFPDVAQSQMALQRRQALIDEMNKQALTPIDPNRAPGVKVSPWEGAAKLAQGLVAGIGQRDVNSKNLALAQMMNQRMWGTQPWKNPDGANASIPMDNGTPHNAGLIAAMTGQAPATGQADLGASQSMPWQGGAPSNGGGMMAQAFPNIPKDKLMLAMQMAPEELGKAMVNQYTPTDAIKTMQQGGMSQPQINQSVSGKAYNDATGSFRPGMLIRNPDGSQQIAPDINTGMGGVIDKSGNMQAFPIPGAAQAKAGIAGAVKGAESANTIYPGQSVNGREGIPVWGNGQPIGAPDSGARPAGWNGQNDPGQPVPPAGGGLNSPQHSPVVLGMTPAEKAQGAKQGETAAEANNTYQKSVSTLADIDSALDRMKVLNTKIPYGTFHIGDAQVALSGIPGVDHDASDAAAEWHNLGSNNILQGIKNLGLARMDIPIFKELEEANGIPLSARPEARDKIIENIRTKVHNNVAAAQNTVAGLNTPQVPQVPPAPTQQYGSPPTQTSSPSPSAASSAPSAAITMLRQNPHLAAAFDAKYGQGASSKVLGQ